MEARGLVPPSRLAPVLMLALFVLPSCGGSAESAADRESSPLVGDVPVLEERTRTESRSSPPAEEATTPAPAPTRPERVAPTPEPVPEPDVPVAEEEWVDEEEAPMTPAPVMIPSGVRMTATLEGTLSTRTHAAGDRFTARVREDVLAEDGMVLVPRGTRLEGLVAESRASSDSRSEALMVLVFDAVVLNGRKIPVVASVVEAEMESAAAASGTRTAATIATGAAAGAVVGRILGRDNRSTAVGAAAGAAVGTGIALTTRDGHATLQDGSRLVVRVDEAVYLSGR